jgi:hypothetical protein
MFLSAISVFSLEEEGRLGSDMPYASTQTIVVSVAGGA